MSAEGSQGNKFGKVSSFGNHMSLLGMPVQYGPMSGGLYSEVPFRGGLYYGVSSPEGWGGALYSGV